MFEVRTIKRNDAKELQAGSRIQKLRITETITTTIAVSLITRTKSSTPSRIHGILYYISSCFKLSSALSGSNSVVECQLPKLDVAGSIPVSRSIPDCVGESRSTKSESRELKFPPGAPCRPLLQLDIDVEDSFGILTVWALDDFFSQVVIGQGAADAFPPSPFTVIDRTDVADSNEPDIKDFTDGTVGIPPRVPVWLKLIVLIGGHGPG